MRSPRRRRRRASTHSVAGGGDGTLSCAAGHLAGTGRPLGILPLGTLNHLARDAGIPAGLEEAAAIIAAGHVREIDLAEVNGRVFVNNSSVGLYPDMVRLREAEQERKGRSKRLAMLSASLTTLRSFPPASALDQRRRARGADPHAFAVRRQQPLRGEFVRAWPARGARCRRALPLRDPRAQPGASVLGRHSRHFRQARPAARLRHRLCAEAGGLVGPRPP